jgi:hypothetical protein
VKACSRLNKTERDGCLVTAKTGAERAKLRRARKRRDVIVCRVEIDARAREWMINTGWLEEGDGNDSAKVAEAAGDLIKRWEKEWRDNFPSRVTLGPSRRGYSL